VSAEANFLSTGQVSTGSRHPHLDPGETAALVLWTERDAVLLTDDLDARNTAKEEEIKVHGSVGVVLYGYSQGALSEAAAKRVLREFMSIVQDPDTATLPRPSRGPASG
jgi:predicted nucleic acid-binding protein